jgi:hypothetical protein
MSTTRTMMIIPVTIKNERGYRDTSANAYKKLIEEANGKYRLAFRYKSTWSRIKKLVTIIGDQIFYGDKEPFMIRKGSADSSASGSQYRSKDENKKKSKDKELITTLDLAFLTLFTLHMLIEECWKKNILLLGITKDSAAHVSSAAAFQSGFICCWSVRRYIIRYKEIRCIAYNMHRLTNLVIVMISTEPCFSMNYL